MTILLWLLFPIAIQHERGGWWRLVAPVIIVALFVDVIANYTELAILTLDFPRKGEYTFSTRLKRLQFNNDWRGQFARYMAKILNSISPNGNHI